MIQWLAAVALGLACLVWGADRFVTGAAALARNLGVAPLVVGLTVVGVGTSAPEILVSAMAAAQGAPAMAVGNAIGSNVANVGLVVGVSALIAPIATRSETLRREFPLMFAVIALAWILLGDGDLGRADGALLLAGLVGLIAIMVRLARAARRSDPLGGEFASRLPAGGMGTPVALGWSIVGLLVLLAASRAVVWGASGIAGAFGVSDLVIGLTVVAVGTSLPELAAALTGVLKGEPDIALGNVIGSNMFNLLPVLGLPGIIAPGPLDSAAMQRDYPVMVALSIALFLMAFGFRGPGRINRAEGGALAAAFFGYQAFLYTSSA